MKRLLPLTALLALSLTLAQTAPAPVTLAAERELVQRVLNFDYGPFEVETRLLVGQLPPQPLAPLPSLPGGRIVGSVVRTSGSPDFPNSQSLYLDSSAPPAQVRAALETALGGLGWTAFPRQGSPFSEGGFQPQQPVDALSYYRLEPPVRLNATVKRVGNVTQVGLNLNRDLNLRERLQYESRGDFPRSNLPALRPPEGTTVQPRGSGGGSGTWNNSASIQSPLTAAGLLDFYAGQLRAAGWTLLTRTPPGKLTTSVWRFTDGDRNDSTGVLTLREDAPGRYSAQLSSFWF